MDKLIVVLSVESTSIESTTIGDFLISTSLDYKVKIFYNSVKMEFNMNNSLYPSFEDIRQRAEGLLL